MSIHIALITVGLAFAPVASATAQSIHETHTDISGPGGKSPIKLYRPIASNDCSSGIQHHQTGKIPSMPALKRDTIACKVQVADRSPTASPNVR